LSHRHSAKAAEAVALWKMVIGVPRYDLDAL
jgi:hypothetical protein